MAGRNLGGQFPAIFARHGTLKRFQQVDDRAVVVVELFGAIADLYTSTLAQIFVVCGFIGILKSAPPAYVVKPE